MLFVTLLLKSMAEIYSRFVDRLYKNYNERKEK